MVNPFKVALVAFLFSTPTYAAEKQSQFMCMAKNIYYEAGAESFEGKLAVGQVVLNRMNHPNYPDSVCGVIYQRNQITCQFSWVCEDRKPINHKSRNWQDSIEAAKLLLTQEYQYDRISDKVLFFKTVSSPFKWKTHYVKVATIGNHDFYMRKTKKYAYKG